MKARGEAQRAAIAALAPRAQGRAGGLEGGDAREGARGGGLHAPQPRHLPLQLPRHLHAQPRSAGFVSQCLVTCARGHKSTLAAEAAITSGYAILAIAQSCCYSAEQEETGIGVRAEIAEA